MLYVLHFNLTVPKQYINVEDSTQVSNIN